MASSPAKVSRRNVLVNFSYVVHNIVALFKLQFTFNLNLKYHVVSVGKASGLRV